jgi:hypothetical protein
MFTPFAQRIRSWGQAVHGPVNLPPGHPLQRLRELARVATPGPVTLLAAHPLQRLRDLARATTATPVSLPSSTTQFRLQTPPLGSAWAKRPVSVGISPLKPPAPIPGLSPTRLPSRSPFQPPELRRGSAPRAVSERNEVSLAISPGEQINQVPDLLLPSDPSQASYDYVQGLRLRQTFTHEYSGDPGSPVTTIRSYGAPSYHPGDPFLVAYGSMPLAAYQQGGVLTPYERSLQKKLDKGVERVIDDILINPRTGSAVGYVISTGEGYARLYTREGRNLGGYFSGGPGAIGNLWYDPVQILAGEIGSLLTRGGSRVGSRIADELLDSTGNKVAGSLSRGTLESTTAEALGTRPVSVGRIAGNELRLAGNPLRDETANLVRQIYKGRPGYQIRTEVFKRTPFGKRFMDVHVEALGDDFAMHLGGIETKLGSSVYGPWQSLKDTWLKLRGYPVALIRRK